MTTGSQDITRQVVDRFKQRSREYAQGIASRVGPPANAHKLSTDEIVRMWNFTTQQDPHLAYQMLIANGVTPQQALDQVHPNRSALYRAPTLKERVRKAEQIKKLVESHGSDVDANA